MSDLAGLSDADLVRRMAAGNEDAFVALYRRRQGAVYRFAFQMSGSAVAAEEVTQEVFLVLIESANRYDESRGPVLSWLFGVARNRVWRWLEKDGRHSPIDEETEETDGTPASTGRAVLDELERAETLEAVRQAVLSLPPHYREAVVLCDLQETSYEEAARIVGCAVGTVRSRLACGMEEDMEAPPHVEDALLAAFRDRRQARGRRARIIARGVAASVVMLFVSAAVLLRRPPAAPVPVASRVAPATTAVTPQAASIASPREELRPPGRRRPRVVRPRGTEVGTGFLPVAGADPFEPLERGRLVRVRLPRVSLAAFGLPMNEDRAAETVTADVLLGDDGAARAIRFVQ